MTPIKKIWFNEAGVYWEDFVGKFTKWCTTEEFEIAQMIALALGTWHNKPVEQLPEETNVA